MTLKFIRFSICVFAGLLLSANILLAQFPVPSITDNTEPIKCLTPSIIYSQTSDSKNALEIRSAIDGILDTEITNTELYLSPSGKFILNYTRTGVDAVPLADLNNNLIPDYIELAAQFAEESYTRLVRELGYTDPLIPGVPYEIRFRQINSYGFTQSAGATSFIVVHRNFEGFPSNNDPAGDVIGALKVTIAHEFKHAIQYAVNRWQGNTGSVSWVEMDATMIEEVVYPEVDDYLNYLNTCASSACSVIRDPNRSTPGSYYHATWMLFFEHHIGSDFWVDVWSDIEANPSGAQMFELIRRQLRLRGLDYTTEFTRNHLWHLATGNRTIDGYGFPDAADFPSTTLQQSTIIADSSRSLPEQSRRRAAQYLEVANMDRQFGELLVDVNFNVGSVGVGLLALDIDGSVIELIESGNRIDNNGFFRISTGIMTERTNYLAMVVSNPDEFDQDITYTLGARELPDVITLSNNYPNPFNPSTTIPFSIPENSHVRLVVYDIQGRMVTELINESLSAGFYDIRVRATDWASGVYLYSLQTNSEIRTGKMILLK